MSRLNYHHLNYFWHVVKIDNLTKAALSLHVSQSSLSAQIKNLEESIGAELFTRRNRKLVLTDIGRIVFSYAESIFNKGDELEAFIRSAFDALCARYQFQPNIVGEADDMAMLRLLARDSLALAVMPEVVVKDEISAGKLTCYTTLPDIYEHFYAVTVNKLIPNRLVSDLIKDFAKN